MPTGRPSQVVERRARSITCWKLGIGNWPSNAVLAGRTSGRRSRARSVSSSAKVKSSVNQPVMLTPSITLVVRRPANSGWEATSVVPPISFSCRATSTPSDVDTRSGSMKSAHWAIASS
jgi:hypothetical protein